MKNVIKEFYNAAMGNLMEAEAKTHKKFFTQAEFEANKGKIFRITHAKTKADDLLNRFPFAYTANEMKIN